MKTKPFSPEWTPQVIGPCPICKIVIVESTVAPVDENDLSQAVIFERDGTAYHALCWKKWKGQ